MSARQLGLVARLVRVFVDSRLSVLLLLAALAAGAAGLALTPREEEPQIVVPMVDVFIAQPGVSPAEIERNTVRELEGLMRGLSGVEHVYSEVREGEALVTVRFEVGHDREKALVDVFTRIDAEAARAPLGVTGWTVRPVDIDDVPILTLALSGGDLEAGELRRLAEELADRLGAVDEVSVTQVIGGAALAVEVEIDREALAARRIPVQQVTRSLRAANVRATVGPVRDEDRAVPLGAGALLGTREDVEEVIVGVHDARPVRVADVAHVAERFMEPTSYTRLALGPAAAVAGIAAGSEAAGDEEAVFVAVAKRKGSNAVRVAEDVLAEVEAARVDLLPDGVRVTVTRNDGESSNEKINELVGHIVVGLITVILVLILGLGWREALIVAIAVPVTFSVALFFDLVAGYTINRVTLFALVLSLGLLVDDPVVDVENIHRHLAARTRPFKEAIIYAVNEVRPPLILATLTVIVSFLPMFFITGMMGPYMAPMPFNIAVVMVASMVVALTITPWAAKVFLAEHHAAPPAADREAGGRVARAYRGALGPLLRQRALGAAFLGGLVLALFGAVALAAFGIVPLKMLPFANKDRLQVVVDMAEGTSLERTDAVVRELALAAREVPEVTFVESYAGTASAHDFQGLVRHEFLRRGDHVGELRLGLLAKGDRAASSHEIALRIRPALEAVAGRHGARIRLAEVPPGPPVLQTLVAEVTGPPGADWEELVAVAAGVRRRMEAEPGVADVDWLVSDTPARAEIRVDPTLAALHGVSVQDVTEALSVATVDRPVTTLHVPGERHPLPIVARLPRDRRSGARALEELPIAYGEGGGALLVEQVTRREPSVLPRSITRKDLERVAFVTADTVGVTPPAAVLSLASSLRRDPLPPGYRASFAGEGEWQITLEVFRDLGLAFAAALLGIYVILVGQTGSLAVPLVMMVAIPITAIGIFPGFWLINVLTAEEIAGYANPTYFTATAMIGMIALAGIVVRNSVILIDFIDVLREEGHSLTEAVLRAGAVRLRPILLTAATALLGVWVMTLDPVFSGLAWSFIFGILASTSFTLLAVPLVYYRLREREAASAESLSKSP
ncbi:MAG: efflux RND transporter permease subunit [Planctomycetota bacterium]